MVNSPNPVALEYLVRTPKRLAYHRTCGGSIWPVLDLSPRIPVSVGLNLALGELFCTEPSVKTLRSSCTAEERFCVLSDKTQCSALSCYMSQELRK